MTETFPTGWELDSASCVIQSATPTPTGTAGTNGVTGIEIKSGLETICTFNDLLAEGTITVIKHVVNDNGGTKTAGDFTISLNDAGNTTFTGVESPGTTKTFTHGYAYSVSETGPSGYTETKTGDCSGTIVAGANKTCTITNNDNAPSLTLVKTVTNDNGGTAAASDWTLTATGPTGFSGAGPSVSNGASFDAGTYALSESGPAGYTASAWVCAGGTQDGAYDHPRPGRERHLHDHQQ